MAQQPSSSQDPDELFDSSPGFSAALATLPLREAPQTPLPQQPNKEVSSSRTLASQSFLAANRKRKRASSPARKNVGDVVGFGLAPRPGWSGSSSQRKATIDDLMVYKDGQLVGGPESEHDEEMDRKGLVRMDEELSEGDDAEAGSDEERPTPDLSYLASNTYEASTFGGIGQYLRNKRKKLQVQNEEIVATRAANHPQIFKGIAIYFNGYMVPSLEQMREMLQVHGGLYVPYLDRKSMVTHIVATTLTPAKHREFKNYRVCTPAWVLDSIAASKVLDWRTYRLLPKGGEMEGMVGGMSQWMGKGGGSQVAGGKSEGKAGRDAGEVKEHGRGQVVEAVEGKGEMGPPSSDLGVIEGTSAQQADEKVVRDGERSNMDAMEVADTPAEPLPTLTPGTSNPPHTLPPSISFSSSAKPTPLVPISSTPTKPSTPIPIPSLTDLSPNSTRAVFAPYKADAPPISTDPGTWAGHAAMGYAWNQENKDAKRLMQSEEWRGQHTAVNDGFLEGFFSNSRLHHLSMWKAELKVLVAKAQQEAESSEVVHKLAPGAGASQEDTPATEAATANSLSFASAVLPKTSPRKPLLHGTTTSTSGSSGPTNGTGPPKEKVIFHVDFDAFFVSCGIATRPELKGKPVVVCHSQGPESNGDGKGGRGTGSGGSSTSEVASCSYEARAMGAKNGMSLGQVRRLCPEVLTIPYEFETYKRFSLSFYTILMAYADELQAVSVDEALIDVTGRVSALAQAPPAFEAHSSQPSTGGVAPDAVAAEPTAATTNSPSHQIPQLPPAPRDWAKDLAEMIRDDVRKATGCEVSIGIGGNILLARLATRHAKPAGSFHLTREQVPTFLQDLDIGELPGVGWSTKKKIEAQFGSTSCGGLLVKTKGSFQALLGNKVGESLFNFIRGIDDRKLEPHKERKSVSAEVNYGIRFISTEEAEKFLGDLSEEVAKRLRAVNRKGRLLTLKVMVRHPDAPLEAPKFMGHGVCNTFNKSAAIATRTGGATDSGADIARAVIKLYRSQGFDATDLRGVGMQVTKLEGAVADEPNREAGQAMLSFGIPAGPAAAAQPKGKEKAMVPITRLSPPPRPVVADDEEDGPDLEVVRPYPGSPSVSRTNTLSHAAAAPAHVEIPAPLTTISKFGRAKPAVRSAIAVPNPGDVDKDMWVFVEDDVKETYRREWARLGLDVPVELRGKVVVKKEALVKRGAAAKGVAKLFGKATDTKAKARGKARSQSPEKLKRTVDMARARSRSKTPAALPEVVDLDSDDIEVVAVNVGKSGPTEVPPALPLAPAQPEPGPSRRSPIKRPLGAMKTSELQSLGIHAETLRELPQELQDEIVGEEKGRRQREKLLSRKGMPVRLDTQPLGRSERSPSKPIGGGSRGRERPKIVLAGPSKVRPQLNKTSDVEDISKMISKWMAEKGGSPPDEREVKGIRKWIVRCVDRATGGLGGVDDAGRVMSWWREVCRSRYADDRDGELSKSWKEAFLQVKTEVDEAMAKRFGEGVTLKLP